MRSTRNRTLAIAAVFAYLAFAPSTGCNKYAGLSAGYRTLGLVESAGEEADKQIGLWLRHQGKKCLELHKSRRAPAYATCINPKRAKRQTWKFAVLGINTALATAKATLVAYHAYLDGKKGGKKVNWLRVVRPALCELSKILRLLEDAIPRLKEARKVLAVVQAVTCG